MSGYGSNTTLTRILCLKWFYPVHESYVFSYFIFKIFYVLSMINSYLLRQREISSYWLLYRDCLFLTFVEKKGCCIFFLIYGTMKCFSYIEWQLVCRKPLVDLNQFVINFLKWRVYVIVLKKSISVVWEHYWNKHVWRIMEIVSMQQK